MGKDFTPKELHQADKQYHFSTTLLSVNNQDGSKQILRDPEDPICKEYPNLSFLIDMAAFSDIVKAVKHSKKKQKKLHEIEEVVANLIRQDDAKETLKVSNKDKTILWWYTGELDPHFYYGEVNEKRFIEYIAKRIND